MRRWKLALSRLTRWLKVGLCLALALAAVAILVNPPRRTHGGGPGVTVVDYWEKWNGDELSQLQQVIDDFNRTVGAEKHIRVECLSTSVIDQKIMIATAAGVPPDICGVWDKNIATMAALDALEPLDDLAAAHGIVDRIYKPIYWSRCHADGHLVALVSTPAATALHYNKRIFAESADKLRAAGLDPTRPPATLEELDAYAKVLDVREGSAIRRTGFLPMEPDWWREFYGNWFGGDWWDPVAKRFTLDSPGMIRAYSWLRSYSQRLGADAINEFHGGTGTFDSPQNPFLTGEVAMEIQGPWMANYIGHLKPSMSAVKWPAAEAMTHPVAERRENCEWAAAPFPSAASGPQGAGVARCEFDCLVIPKGAKHVREAFEFMAYLNRQEVMEKLCMLHCKNSPLAKVSTHFVDDHPNPYIAVFEALARSPNAHAAEQTPVFAEAVKELDDAIDQIALLKATPEEALGRAQVRMQAKYEQFAERQRRRRGER